MRPPTDFKLLRAIYDRHRGDYASTDPPRVYVPIDIPAIARDLGVETNSVFGRLYHHLDRIYGEPAEEGSPRRFLFSPKVGQEANCVNFPHLEAVLAGLWEQRNRDRWTYWTAAISLAVAIASLIVSAFVATGAI